MFNELNLAEVRNRKASTNFIDRRGESNEIILSGEQREEAFKFCFDRREENKSYRFWVKLTNPETGRRITAVLCFESLELEGGGYEIGGISINTPR